MNFMADMNFLAAPQVTMPYTGSEGTDQVLILMPEPPCELHSANSG
jgi:hypothetical protein